MKLVKKKGKDIYVPTKETENNMGEMSEMMLGISASDLFERDLRHVIRHEQMEEAPDNPKYMPTLENNHNEEQY